MTIMQHKKANTLAVLAVVSLLIFTQESLAATSETLTPSPEGNNSIHQDSYEKQNKNIVKALPIYSFPLTRFNFSFAFTDEKTNYVGGETLQASGTLGYTSNQKEEVDKIMQQCRIREKSQLEQCPDQNCKDRGEGACNFKGYSLPFIEDAGIIAQVWRMDSDEEYLKGNNLIDEFYVARDLGLEENQPQKFSLAWKIPEELQSGSYYLALSVNGSDRFNFMGFPFNPSSKAVAYGFKIKSSNPGIVIDKNNIILNGKPYNYIEPVPVISENEAKVDLAIENLNPKEEKVKVKYEIAEWSQEDPGDIIGGKEEYIDIPANSDKDFHISVPIAGLCSTCNIKVTASTGKSVSQSNIRFSQGTEGMGIFRFLGIAKTEEGKLAPVFCPRSAHWDKKTSNREIKISLLDSKDEIINIWSGKGLIPTDTICYIIKDSSLNLENVSYVKIKGEIYNDGKELEDQKEIIYNLSQKRQGSDQKENVPGETEDDNKMVLIIFLISLILIALAAFVAIKIKRNKEKQNGDALPG